MTTTIPTLTVRLDEVEGLTGWTVRLDPGTPERPDPILTVADAEGVVQAARRVRLGQVELEPLIESVPGTTTGTLVDLLVPIDVLDPTLREGAGITVADLPPRTARRLAQRAHDMRTIRVINAEEAAARPPAPAPAGQSDPADADDAEWDF